MIAATAKAHRLTAARENVRDFRKFNVESPFDSGCAGQNWRAA